MPLNKPVRLLGVCTVICCTAAPQKSALCGRHSSGGPGNLPRCGLLELSRQGARQPSPENSCGRPEWRGVIKKSAALAQLGSTICRLLRRAAATGQVAAASSSDSSPGGRNKVSSRTSGCAPMAWAVCVIQWR